MKAEDNDYQIILHQAICDRLVEAFAEYLHHQVRTQYWGYAPDENLSHKELLKSRFDGIRPAYGYPACPEHTEKETLFKLLKVEQQAGITLTEHHAMLPAASISGIYFAHPKARYFGLGKVAQDQLQDYAKRKRVQAQRVEKSLSMQYVLD